MKARITETHEYPLDPANYPEGITPEEMVEIDLENGYLDYVEDWTITVEIIP